MAPRSLTPKLSMTDDAEQIILLCPACFSRVGLVRQNDGIHRGECKTCEIEVSLNFDSSTGSASFSGEHRVSVKSIVAVARKILRVYGR